MGLDILLKGGNYILKLFFPGNAYSNILRYLINSYDNNNIYILKNIIIKHIIHKLYVYSLYYDENWKI